MKKLKQTLCKQQAKKQKPVNTSTTLGQSQKFHKPTRNPTYLYKSPNKPISEQGLQLLLLATLKNSSSTGLNIDKIVKEFLQGCQENQKLGDTLQSRLNKTTGMNMSNSMSMSRMVSEEVNRMENIREIVEGMLERGEQRGSQRELLRGFYEELGKVIVRKNKISRKQKLEQYDKLIKLLSPRKPPNQIPKNIKLKVTKQQYQIKRQSSPDESIRIGSQGKRVKTSGSNKSSTFKSENGHQKLKKFLQKDTSLKIIKTKVQYDYSAIFQASKNKIQTRKQNMTTLGFNKNVYDVTSKLNKAKKNQGFVFYRPKPGTKKE